MESDLEPIKTSAHEYFFVLSVFGSRHWPVAVVILNRHAIHPFGNLARSWRSPSLGAKFDDRLQHALVAHGIDLLAICTKPTCGLAYITLGNAVEGVFDLFQAPTTWWAALLENLLSFYLGGLICRVLFQP